MSNPKKAVDLKQQVKDMETAYGELLDKYKDLADASGKQEHNLRSELASRDKEMDMIYGKLYKAQDRIKDLERQRALIDQAIQLAARVSTDAVLQDRAIAQDRYPAMNRVPCPPDPRS